MLIALLEEGCVLCTLLEEGCALCALLEEGCVPCALLEGGVPCLKEGTSPIAPRQCRGARLGSIRLEGGAAQLLATLCSSCCTRQLCQLSQGGGAHLAVCRGREGCAGLARSTGASVQLRVVWTHVPRQTWVPSIAQLRKGLHKSPN